MLGHPTGQLRTGWLRGSWLMPQLHTLSSSRSLVQVCSHKEAGVGDGGESGQVFHKSLLSSGLFLSRWQQQAVGPRIRVRGDRAAPQQRAEIQTERSWRPVMPSSRCLKGKSWKRLESRAGGDLDSGREPPQRC